MEWDIRHIYVEGGPGHSHLAGIVARGGLSHFAKT